MSQELITLLTAATPISELRGAIPLAFAFDFSPFKAYLLAIIGNGIVIVPLLLFLRYGSGWAMQRFGWCNRVLQWVFDRTRRRHGEKFAGMGLVALAVFVAVPLPMTGAWTAAIIAFLVDLPLWRAATAILIGVLTAGLIVLSISLGVVHIW